MDVIVGEGRGANACSHVGDTGKPGNTKPGRVGQDGFRNRGGADGVGAALLATDGRIFQGCNVENASYGLTLCAERVAVAAAVTAGCQQFKALAILGGSRKALPTPCGACLQVLAEFCRPDCPIILASGVSAATWQTYRLKDLLPHAFKLNPTAAGQLLQ